MVNIWDFANDLPRVKVTAKDGSVFVGKIIDVSDAEEMEEDEDYLSVEAKSGEIRSFAASEIETIERIG